MEIIDGAITIPVKVFDKPTTAIIDTGASKTLINRTFLTKNNFEISTSGKMKFGGAIKNERLDLLSELNLELFGANLNMRDIGIYENSELPSVILGLELFSHFVVQIDYPNSRMRLADRKSIDLKGHENVEFNVVKEFGALPVVQVNLNKERNVDLILDTGFNGAISVERIIASEQKWLEKFKNVKVRVKGLHATTQNDSFLIPTVKIGPYEIADTQVMVQTEGDKYNIKFKPRSYTGSRIRTGRKIQGVLGYDILRNFVLTIDYGRSLLHLGLPEQKSKS
ncbi:MAG: retropepsin-like domain-containing protein [Pseudobacteriovorax sp.]|nr:retropepsin-like domain-containing protein [Pseudobacteriovorax sp.]